MTLKKTISEAMTARVERADMDRRQFFITTAAVGGAMVSVSGGRAGPGGGRRDARRALVPRTVRSRNQCMDRRRARRYRDDSHRTDGARSRSLDRLRHDDRRRAAVRLEQGARRVCVRESRRQGKGSGMDTQEPGGAEAGAHRSARGWRIRRPAGRPTSGSAGRRVSPHVDASERLGQDEPLLLPAGRRRGARTPAAGGGERWGVPTSELAAKDSIITHAATGRTMTIRCRLRRAPRSCRIHIRRRSGSRALTSSP